MTALRRVRICLLYDRLFPLTLGGAERWYRNLAEQLAAAGHDVTYVTMRHWERDVTPEIPGVKVVVVGPKLAPYDARRGGRTFFPPPIYGVFVALHLLRHGRHYDVVHTASFPYFSLLAAGLIKPLRSFALVVDWHEVWTRAFWRAYIGRAAGTLGYLVQRACVRVPQQAFCFSRLHRDRLVGEGLRSEPIILEGEYAGSLAQPDPGPAEPLVVFAGRHIPEKRAPAAVAGIAEAQKSLPGLRGVIFGEGPHTPQVHQAIEANHAQGFVTAPGFVPNGEVEETLGRALCMLLPSSREGYGLVVVEAVSKGIPAIVVAGEDNAATELIVEGVNGFVAPSASPQDLAAAILRVHAEGPALRRRAAEWFGANATRLSIESSVETVQKAYADATRT